MTKLIFLIATIFGLNIFGSVIFNGTAFAEETVPGIDCNQNTLLNGQCKFQINKFLGIKNETDGDSSVGLFVQDIVLSATFFIGTIVTVAIIVSGLLFIFAAASGKDPSSAKKGLINSLIGLLIVICSYVIIRLVQYIAKGV
ncbi:MAG: hypothetical protein WC872_01560 [Candidatus Absconditabacterales bacterium]